MLHLVSSKNLSGQDRLMAAMFRDRKRVFVDWKGWDVPVVGDQERDQFDDDFAEYMIIAGPNDQHLASLRLLRTDRPHILGDLFGHLCDKGAPRSPLIREITRLCVSPDAQKDDRMRLRKTLVVALTEHAYVNGLAGYSCVVEGGHLSQIVAHGWRVEPLGLPIEHRGEWIGGLQIHIDASTVADLQRAGTLAAAFSTMPQEQAA